MPAGGRRARGRVVGFLGDIFPSIAATFLSAVGGFLSLGLLGLVLYHLVSPALSLAFPPLDRWDQSLVWPLIVAAPVLWSPSFLVAGIVNRLLKHRGAGRTARIALYVALVWLAALASWWFLLSANPDVWT